MYTTIFIGGINRSGGSLLARLFDGHPQVVSYPTELGFPFDTTLYPIFESYAGVPMRIPAYDGSAETNVFELLEIPKEKPKVILKLGKEQADPLGVRKNYLEKVFYGTVETDFDYDIFTRLFNEYRKKAKTIAELYDARHKAYFKAWDEGRYQSEGVKYVVMHDSGGLYLTNIDTFFAEFKDSVFILPLRDVMGYIASEKTRIARRFYGSRRFSYPPFPNTLVKTFRTYDLDAQIRAWAVALTRAVLLQEKYGAEGRFVVYTYENLMYETEKTMRGLSDKIGLRFDPILLVPTIAGRPWAGNSQQGRQEGINKDLVTYYPDVLASDEIKRIEDRTSPLREYLAASKKTPIDLTRLPRHLLTDYKFQNRFFNDEEKITLYYALVNTGRRSAMVKSPHITSLLAYFYSLAVRIIHMPRMLKLRFFPGLGKQNYT